MNEDQPRTSIARTPEDTVGEPLYRWHWCTRLPERRGQLLRLIVSGRMNSCLVEFIDDGWRVVTSRNALRRA